MGQNIDTILGDEAFLKKVINMDMSEAQKAFENRGIELSKNDMIAIQQLVTLQLENPDLIPEDGLKKIGGGKINLDLETTKKIKNISMAIAALIVAGSALYITNHVKKVSGDASSTLRMAKGTLRKADIALGNVNETVNKLKDPEGKGWLARQFLGG